MSDFSRRRHYLQEWKRQQRRLRLTALARGLGAALTELERDQYRAEVIRSRVADLECWRLLHPTDSSRSLLAQCNPQRAARPGAEATSSRSARNVPCALCPLEICRHSQFQEFGFELPLSTRRSWIAWPNPFPLHAVHFTVAARRHEDQGWIGMDSRSSLKRLSGILEAMAELARALPSFVVYHNSPGAGASQMHLHLQLLQRIGTTFPIEVAAEASTTFAQRRSGAPVFTHHPIPFVVFEETQDSAVEAVLRWVSGWLEAQSENLLLLAANIVAKWEPETGRHWFFFVSRSRKSERIPMLSGRVASLEVMGELVLSSSSERDLLLSGALNYETVAAQLAALETPGLGCHASPVMRLSP